MPVEHHQTTDAGAQRAHGLAAPLASCAGVDRVEFRRGRHPAAPMGVLVELRQGCDAVRVGSSEVCRRPRPAQLRRHIFRMRPHLRGNRPSGGRPEFYGWVASQVPFVAVKIVLGRTEGVRRFEDACEQCVCHALTLGGLVPAGVDRSDVGEAQAGRDTWLLFPVLRGIQGKDVRMKLWRTPLGCTYVHRGLQFVQMGALGQNCGATRHIPHEDVRGKTR